MIVKMKKYAFLVYHKDYDRFLESLREQGVLHVKERGSANLEGGALRDKLLLLNRIQEAIKFLEKKIDPKINTEPASVRKQGAELLTYFDALRGKEEQLSQSVSLIGKEIAVLEPWGNIDWNTIEKLNVNGWTVSFYSTLNKNWNAEWETNYNAFQIAHIGSNVLFISVTRKGEPLEIEADSMKLPRQGLSETVAEMARLKQERSGIDKEWRIFAGANFSSLKLYKNQVQQQFDFEKVVLNSDKVVDGTVSLLEGFIPVEKELAFQAFLNDERVFYEVNKPGMTEKVPVLLKNNWFATLFEPIGKLYTLPNYHELDLTPLYAPFYWLFFGFCVGDLGYGLILVFSGFFMATRVKPEMKAIMKLIGFLGISTILFGILSGTCFGMSLYEMRLGFYANMDDLLKSKEISVNKMLFNLALLFGAIQIFYGMFVKAANEIYQNGWKSALSTIGWITIIFGFAVNYALKKTSIDPYTIRIIFYSFLGIGFLGAFLFNNPERNIFANMAFGIWDTYNMATGLLGDWLSYIRLFALSICSGILGYVFNSLAFAMAPDIPVVRVIVIALLLIICHTINMAMAMLGAFVHPMRLTFVEFYKNAGFTGGGKRYLPFKIK